MVTEEFLDPSMSSSQQMIRIPYVEVAFLILGVIVI